MIDFAAARQTMVDSQIRPNGVTDLRIISAFLDVPRETFAPQKLAELAYLDRDIPLAAKRAEHPRFLVSPMVTAKLIEAADIAEGDRVLVVGCASGYAAAIIARLARAVIALEEDADLARAARERLQSAPNIEVVVGPLTEGWPPESPYDLIYLDGAVELIPQSLAGQLQEGGRIVGVLQAGPVGKGTIWPAAPGRLSPLPVFDAPAPLLPGFAKPAQFAF